MNIKTMMKEKTNTAEQVIIMHPCPLTLLGLRHFLSQCLPRASFSCCDSLKALRECPGVLTADLIISELYDADEAPESGISWLSWLQLERKEKPLLIFTDYENTSALGGLLIHGSVSVVSGSELSYKLNGYLLQILDGERVITGGHVLPLPQKQLLTSAERQVYLLLQKGLGVSQIADRLCRSVKTVSTHKRRMMMKLNAKSEVELFSRMRA